MMKIRPYQQQAIDGTFEAWAEGKSALTVLPTGTGKTVVATHILERVCRETGQKALFLCHREELIWQTKEKIEKYTPLRVGIEMADYRAHHNSDLFGRMDVIVSTTQTQYTGRMKEFDPEEFGALIVDECFIAGTLIDGKPIEQIQPGDIVNSFNHQTGMIEKKRVKRLFRKKAKHLVQMTLTNGKTIICTPNHPIFSVTLNRYVPAALLTNDLLIYEKSNDNVSYPVHRMRQNVSSHERKKNLFGFLSKSENPSVTDYRSSMFRLRKTREMHGETSAVCEEREGHLLEGMPAYPKINCWVNHTGQNQQEICIGSNESKQSHDEARDQGKSFYGDERARTNYSQGKWNWSHKARSDIMQSIGLDVQSTRLHQNAERFGLSNVLQDRRCMRSSKNRNRGGWEFSQTFGSTISRSKEAGIPGVVGVAYLEILKSGSRCESGQMPGDCEVFNLEIEDNHNYFANGVLVHNCHHYASPAYKRVIDHYKQNSRLHLMGLTATPNRHDEQALGQIFDAVAINYGIAEGIDDGWLVPIRQRLITVDELDLSQVRTTGGELNEGDLDEVMRTRRIIEGTAIPTLELLGNRKALVFATTVAHAEDLCHFFNAKKPNCARWLCGSTPKDERRQILSDHAAGKFQILLNVEVLTEGYNDPSIEVIVILKPTKSTPSYTQKIGRGTRPLEGLVDLIESAESRKAAIAASSKNCIAEGQNVLTDVGLIPIEKVTTLMKVWDGVEFVNHSGVVCRGIKPVIKYAGLLATPDHKVLIHDHESKSPISEAWKTFGECAKQQTPIRVTGINGKAIRETEGYFKRDISHQRATTYSNRVPEMRNSIHEGFVQHSFPKSRMRHLCTSTFCTEMAVETGSPYKKSLRKSTESQFPSLWRKRDKIQFCLAESDGDMGTGKFRASSKYDIRQNQQRWSLRTRKYPICDSNYSNQQQKRATNNRKSACVLNSSSRDSLLSNPSDTINQARANMESDYSSSRWNGRRPRPARSIHGQARVFDILNAGPRHRFTVEGLLVSNCIEIFDFVGNSGKHKLVTCADVLGGIYPDDVIEAAKKIMENSPAAKDVSEALREAAEESRRQHEEKKRLEMEQRAKFKLKVRHTSSFIDPFDVFHIQPRRTFGWEVGKRLSDKQQNLIEKHYGMNAEEMDYAEGKQLVDELFKRWDTGQCTFKQAKLLNKYGLPTDVKREQATAWIDKIKANKWQLPNELYAHKADDGIPDF